MSNPFDLIDARLSNIETLLLELRSPNSSTTNQNICNPEEDRLVNKKEAAKHLGCSVSTIDNLRRRGVLTRIRVGGKSARFRMSEIAAIVESKTDPSDG